MTRTTTLPTITCPCCGKPNHHAHDDGATDGPREYHAACWAKTSATMSDDEIRAAWDASPLAAI